MAEKDSQLELKKRARRRLVGATALALFAAIVLPMVMDSEPKPTGQDLQIRIPAKDSSSLSSKILPVPHTPAATPLPTVVPDTSVKQIKPSSELKQHQSAVAETPKKSTENAPEKSADQAVEKLIQKFVEEPVPQKEVAKAEKASPSKAQWVVMLGAYRDPGNVTNLQAKLKAEGYKFFTEPLKDKDGVKKTRVRAGPFASKEAAEKARDRIKRIGVDGLVAPQE